MAEPTTATVYGSNRRSLTLIMLLLFISRLLIWFQPNLGREKRNDEDARRFDGGQIERKCRRRFGQRSSPTTHGNGDAGECDISLTFHNDGRLMSHFHKYCVPEMEILVWSESSYLNASELIKISDIWHELRLHHFLRLSVQLKFIWHNTDLVMILYSNR